MFIRNFLFMVFFAMIASSCTIMYIPTMQNVPMFHEKGEVKVAAGYRNYEIAFAPGDHFAVQLNGFYNQNKPITLGSTDEAFDFKRRSYSFDGAVGTFRKIRNNQSFEVFAGMGWGYANINFGNLEVHGRDGCISNFYKFYIQSSYEISQNLKKGFIGFALSGRITSVDFYNLQNLSYGRTGSDGAFFIEPAATLKFGHKGINAILQTQLSRPVNIDERSGSYQRYGVYWLFSGGLEFQLNRIFRKKKPASPDNAISMF